MTENIITNKLTGRFYFKLTSNGNLIGEFSNDCSGKPQETATESSDLRGEPNGSYLGVYSSTWQENKTACFAELTITQKKDTNRLFSLDLKDSQGKLIFKG